MFTDVVPTLRKPKAFSPGFAIIPSISIVGAHGHVNHHEYLIIENIYKAFGHQALAFETKEEVIQLSSRTKARLFINATDIPEN